MLKRPATKQFVTKAKCLSNFGACRKDNACALQNFLAMVDFQEAYKPMRISCERSWLMIVPRRAICLSQL